MIRRLWKSLPIASPGAAALMAGWAIFFAFALVAAGAEPLYQQEPFDRITLDKANQSKVLEVEPLDFPQRRLPSPLPKSGKLIVHLLNEPEKEYEVLWRAIEKVELFEQMVLDEANSHVAAGEFETAYDYFQHLLEVDPKLPGLDRAIEDDLYEEAKSLQRGGRFEAALARLRELHQRNPQRPEVERALGAATEKLVQRHAADGDYWLARRYLGNLAGWYPQHAVVKKWTETFRTQAAGFLDQARKALGDGRLREAHQAARRAVRIWPELSGAKQVMEEIHRQYPRVVVGVTLASNDPRSDRLDDWAARRTARLLDRTLTEFAGPGTEGGKYVCPLGQLKIDDLGLRLSLTVRPDIRWSAGEATLTGYDLARHFLAMADPADDAYRPQWAELFSGVSVEKVYSAVVDFERPFVLPAALMQTPVLPSYPAEAAAGGPLANGPYRVDARDETETVYLTNTRYFAGTAGRPKEIVERRFPTGADALRALRRRQIDVIDRLNPWQINTAGKIPGVVVGRYAVPTVHCLVPNMNRPLTSRRTFRRALVYGIHREAILNLLLHGGELPGCRVVSGPFSPGIGVDDPLAYACDPAIESRPYQPHLAVALAEVAFQELVEAAKKEKREPLPSMPPLVLAYPPQDVARLAVEQIRRQLKLVGIQIELKEIEGDLPRQVPPSVDLLYAELAIWEPVVDAGRLLGPNGPARGASPYMRLALDQLLGAGDWPEVGRRLREIHGLAHGELAVVPLWQLTNYFAAYQSVQGIGPSPVTLYQNVEQWQPKFYYPAEDQ